MSAFGTLEKLEGIESRSLGPLQRILLITDGTLTEILEAYFFEPVRLVKLAQSIVVSNASHALLMPPDGENLMERKILLQGSSSGRNYVYAESVIAPDRLPPSFRDALLHSDTPLGRLWLEHRLETFKELVHAKRQSADELAQHFGCDASSSLLMRTYRVFAKAQPVMVISEYFPEKLEGL